MLKGCRQSLENVGGICFPLERDVADRVIGLKEKKKGRKERRAHPLLIKVRRDTVFESRLLGHLSLILSRSCDFKREVLHIHQSSVQIIFIWFQDPVEKAEE